MPLREFSAITGRLLQVVIVEDYDLLRGELVSYLSRPGVCVRGTDDGDGLDTLLREQAADVVIVDLNLPGEDGLSICRRLRTAFPDLGLVMLTARVMPKDRTAGYANGADVYLTKPTNVEELDAVVANLARRNMNAQPTLYRLDRIQLQLVRPDSASVDLTPPEARLLYELSVAAERQMSTDTLQWRLNEFSGRTVNLPVMVSRLRSKLMTAFDGVDAIKAIRGYGYQLTLAIRVD